MGRYKSPDEHPFFPENLLEVVEPSVEYENVIYISHSPNFRVTL
jgi:hypothetical protein